MSFDRGVFTLSLDFELVWGSRDLTPDIRPLARKARVTREQVFGPLLAMLQDRDVVATWATVGHLFLAGARSDGSRLHPDLTPPRHAWRRDWLAGVPAGGEQEHPEFYARSLVLRLRDAGQEVGSHSFTHPIFGDPGCTRAVADSDLARCVTEASALGLTLRSFVFPRNIPGHLDLLARHGFTAWRSPEAVHVPLPGPAGRVRHLAAVALAATPLTVMPTRGAHGLVQIPASASFLPIDGIRRAIPMSRRVVRCVRGLERAAAERRVFHLYTHPINLAAEPATMLAGLGEVIAHACKLRDAGRLDILPMCGLAARC